MYTAVFVEQRNFQMAQVVQGQIINHGRKSTVMAECKINNFEQSQ
jgi:hypothetical protein